MDRQNTRVFPVSLGVLLTACVLLTFAVDKGRTKDEAYVPTEGTQADTSTNRFVYGSQNLIGASLDEIGMFAQDFARHQLKAQGSPEIRLVRTIVRSDVTKLGLGCLPDFAAIEEPPLALVVLKGYFDFRGSVPGAGMEPAPVPGKSSYVVYVFDIWGASPVSMIESRDGAIVKKALNDPSLPSPLEASAPAICPTRVPTSAKSLHYGQDAPGFTSPPPLPQDIQDNLQPTTQPTPQPIGSPTKPGPVPTAEGFPTIPPAPSPIP